MEMTGTVEFIQRIKYAEIPDEKGEMQVYAIPETVENIQELVRCKDCKHREACKNGRGEHGVMCYNSHSASHSWVHEPDWFCADGEEKR